MLNDSKDPANRNMKKFSVFEVVNYPSRERGAVA